jgi:hypothetical protein
MKALLKQNLCQYDKTINAGNPPTLVKRFKESFYEINALFCKR